MTEYLKTTELCEKLGVSRMSIHRWERDPEVNLPKPVRIRGQRFYPVVEIDAWLEQARG